MKFCVSTLSLTWPNTLFYTFVENLHQQLYEINALYPRHVTELQGKIQALEKQNQELQV
jgi:predicted translin family RNA/ssDNA-binding protein